MIRSFVLYLATYALTVAMNYGFAQTPLPLALSYVGNVCGRQPSFLPLDSLIIGGLLAAFVAAYLLRRVPLGQFRTPLKAGGLRYWGKMNVLMSLGAVFFYAAIRTLAADCNALLSDYSISDATSYVVFYSVVQAAVAHLFFDLRRYQFEPVPWRPR